MSSRSLIASAATGAGNTLAPRRSLLRRFSDAFVAHRRARAEQEVARYLRTHRDKLTDGLEREIERRFSGC